MTTRAEVICEPAGITDTYIRAEIDRSPEIVRAFHDATSGAGNKLYSLIDGDGYAWRVIGTNGHPIWEEQDVVLFADILRDEFGIVE